MAEDWPAEYFGSARTAVAKLVTRVCFAKVRPMKSDGVSAIRAPLVVVDNRLWSRGVVSLDPFAKRDKLCRRSSAATETRIRAPCGGMALVGEKRVFGAGALSSASTGVPKASTRMAAAMAPLRIVSSQSHAQARVGERVAHCVIFKFLNERVRPCVIAKSANSRSSLGGTLNLMNNCPLM